MDQAGQELQHLEKTTDQHLLTPDVRVPLEDRNQLNEGINQWIKKTKRVKKGAYLSTREEDVLKKNVAEGGSPEHDLQANLLTSNETKNIEDQLKVIDEALAPPAPKPKTEPPPAKTLSPEEIKNEKVVGSISSQKTKNRQKVIDGHKKTLEKLREQISKVKDPAQKEFLEKQLEAGAKKIAEMEGLDDAITNKKVIVPKAPDSELSNIDKQIKIVQDRLEKIPKFQNLTATRLRSIGQQIENLKPEIDSLQEYKNLLADRMRRGGSEEDMLRLQRETTKVDRLLGTANAKILDFDKQLAELKAGRDFRGDTAEMQELQRLGKLFKEREKAIPSAKELTPDQKLKLLKQKGELQGRLDQAEKDMKKIYARLKKGKQGQSAKNWNEEIKALEREGIFPNQQALEGYLRDNTAGLPMAKEGLIQSVKARKNILKKRIGQKKLDTATKNAIFDAFKKTYKGEDIQGKSGKVLAQLKESGKLDELYDFAMNKATYLQMLQRPGMSEGASAYYWVRGLSLGGLFREPLTQVFTWAGIKIGDAENLTKAFLRNLAVNIGREAERAYTEKENKGILE